MNDHVLDISKRGHTSIQVENAAKLIKSFDINLGVQIMIGLPESNIDMEVLTIDTLLLLNPSEIRIYPVYVIEQSELYDMYLKGDYVPLTLDDAIKRSYEVVKSCQTTDVKIIRLGLQSTDEITQKNDRVVGPVCDNFSEYIMAKIALYKMEKIIKSKLIEDKDICNITFLIDSNIPKSIIIGPKKINSKYIKDSYGINIKVK
ncbi:coproporphyrinogen III oxidase [compost metagenome]